MDKNGCPTKTQQGRAAAAESPSQLESGHCSETQTASQQRTAHAPKLPQQKFAVVLDPNDIVGTRQDFLTDDPLPALHDTCANSRDFAGSLHDMPAEPLMRPAQRVKLLNRKHGNYGSLDVQRAFRAACIEGDVAAVREILSVVGDSVLDVQYAFQVACDGGHVDLVHLLLSLDSDQRVDVHAGEEAAFRAACAGGHVGVVQNLLSLGGDRRINVHAGDEAAFRAACAAGHNEVAQSLLALSGFDQIDASMFALFTLWEACMHGNAGIVRLLLSLEDHRRVDVHDNDDAAFMIAFNKCQTDVLLALQEQKGAFDWELPQNQQLLQTCLRRTLTLGPSSKSVARLRVLPLPDNWASMLLEAGNVRGNSQSNDKSDERILGQALSHCPPPFFAPLVARLAAIHSMQPVVRREGAQHEAVTGEEAALAALALCFVLPARRPVLCRHALRELMWRCDGSNALRRRVSHLLWRGATLPAAAAAIPDGCDVRRLAPLLVRPGRRAMVLRRAEVHAARIRSPGKCEGGCT